MTLLQFSKDLIWIDISSGKQNQHMISEVGHFFDKTLVVLGEGSHNHLRALFANLLCDLWQAILNRLAVYDFSEGFFFRSSITSNSH